MNIVRRNRAELTLLGAIVIFGINYPILKVLSSSLMAFPINAIRFCFAATFMGMFLWGDLKNSFDKFRENILELTLLAGLGYFLSPLCLIYGLEFSTASNAALILAGAPVWTAVLSWLLGNDPIGSMGWIGLFVSTIGLLIVTVPTENLSAGGQSSLYGNLFLVSDSIFWGSYVSLQRNLLDKMDSFNASFWSLIVVLPLFILGTYSFTSFEKLAKSPLYTWSSLLISGVFSMGFAHLWWNHSLRDFGPTTVSVYGNGIPLVTVIIGWLMLGEKFGYQHLIGGVILLIGVWLARKARIKRDYKSLILPEN